MLCPVDECNASYSKVNSLCSHIYRKHRSSIATGLPSTSPSMQHESICVLQPQQPIATIDFSIPASISHDVNQLLQTDRMEQKKKSILFLLQLKEERLLTQVAVNDVVAGFREVFNHTVGHLKAGVNHRLAQSGIEPISIAGLADVFNDISDPFTGLETQYLQDKFIVEVFNCIEAVEIQVGCSHYVTRKFGAKRKKILRRDSFYYVSILKTLKQLLKIEAIRNEVLRPAENNGNLLYDLSDGLVYQKHDFFKNNPRGLQIVAYYDEVETCNPLGSSSGKFKLGCVFFTLGNIRPRFRSSLKSIFLVAIAKSSTIKVNGLDSILKPFLNDMKTLHDIGVTIQYLGKEETWRGCLLAFLADNLAAHELGGFKESFSFARRFCRSCLTDKAMSQSHFREDEFVLRDRVTHSSLCSRLKDPDGPSISVEYGINRCSSLDSLSHFSVVENMPHDIMHDLFEGVVPFEMKLFIRYCIEKKYFTIDVLNNRLAAFDFGYSEIGDKPASIDSDLKLRQTASQIWLLSRIFPLLVGDLIPRDDSHWGCFLKLLKICEICTSPVLSADSAAYLEVLVEEHHLHFQIVYPGVSLIPKTHFLIHFARQILEFGPPIQTWTFRHEAKLRVMKRAARVSNFKNVCQSVAKRHQHLLAYYIHTNQLLDVSTQEGPKKTTVSLFFF